MALRVDALDAVLVEQRRQERRERLRRVAAPLARARERDADLRRARLVGGDAGRAVAAQRPVDAVDGGELRPGAGRPERDGVLLGEEAHGVGHREARVPALVPSDVRVAAVRDERGQVARAEGPQDEPLGDDHAGKAMGRCAGSSSSLRNAARQGTISCDDDEHGEHAGADALAVDRIGGDGDGQAGPHRDEGEIRPGSQRPALERDLVGGLGTAAGGCSTVGEAGGVRVGHGRLLRLASGGSRTLRRTCLVRHAADPPQRVRRTPGATCGLLSGRLA